MTLHRSSFAWRAARTPGGMSLPLYDVEDYGAVGDGAADDSEAFAAAWAALLASGAGGLLYLPRAVVYSVSADTLLQAWPDGQYAMFPIPQVAAGSGMPQRAVGVVGPSNAWAVRVWGGVGVASAPIRTTAVIEATYASAKTWSATHGHPSVFGARDIDHGGAGFSGVTNVNFIADGITIRQPPNPSMCNMNLESCSTHWIGTQSGDVTGDPDASPEPTNATGCNILTSRNNNNVATHIGAVMTWGYFAAVGPGEHLDAGNLIAVRCKIGFPVRRGAWHASHVAMMTIEECPWHIAGYDPSLAAPVVDVPYSDYGQPVIHIGTWDIEDYWDGEVGSAWMDTRNPTTPRAHILDRNNALRGRVDGYVCVVSRPGDAGRTSTLVVTGRGGAITDWQMVSLLDNTARAKADMTAGGNPPPAAAPGIPTIGTATAGDAQATVAFTPAAGGYAADTFTATSTPGSMHGTGAASPIAVTGLANGTAYTFTVHATNGFGSSAESSASNSVTPSSVSYITNDPFTRADNASSMGSTPQSQAWSALLGTWGIISNQAYCSAPSGSSYCPVAVETSAADVTVSADINAVSAGEAGLAVRAADINNFLLVDMAWDTGTNKFLVLVSKRIAGSFTTVMSPTATGIGAGVTFELKAITSGSSVDIYINGVQIGTTLTVAELASNTRHGIVCAGAGSTAARYDNFKVI